MVLLLHESQEVIAKTELDVHSELANLNIYDTVQKQPSRGVPRKSCFENMQQIYGRTPMSKRDFNKAASPSQSAISIKWHNFIEIALPHGCSPENFLHIFRTPFPRSTSRWLLLTVQNRRKLYAKHKSYEKELERRRTNKWRKVKDQEN